MYSAPTPPALVVPALTRAEIKVPAGRPDPVRGIPTETSPEVMEVTVSLLPEMLAVKMGAAVVVEEVVERVCERVVRRSAKEERVSACWATVSEGERRGVEKRGVSVSPQLPKLSTAAIMARNRPPTPPAGFPTAGKYRPPV